MNKLIYKMALLVLALLFNACSIGNSPKWVGKVAPGTYYGEYNYSLGWETANVKIELSIDEEGWFELRETWNGGSCSNGTRVYNGVILLQDEVYNGEKKYWYLIDGHNSERETRTLYSLSPNLELKDDLHATYQSFMNAKQYCVLH